MLARDFWPARKPTTGSGSALVAPSDVTPLSELAVALYVEGAGSVCFVAADGSVDTWAVPANFYLLLPVQQVKATGTTATGIHAIK